MKIWREKWFFGGFVFGGGEVEEKWFIKGRVWEVKMRDRESFIINYVFVYVVVILFFV